MAGSRLRTRSCRRATRWRCPADRDGALAAGPDAAGADDHDADGPVAADTDRVGADRAAAAVHDGAAGAPATRRDLPSPDQSCSGAAAPQPTTSTTPTAGSPAPAGRTDTPPSSGYGYTTPSTARTAGAGRSTARSRTFAATTHRTAQRVSVQLAFRLAKAGRTFLIVRGPAPSCRVAGYIPVRGRKGANTIYFAGRVHGRRLEPGVYLISLSPNRRLAPGAATEYVRVVSPRRSIPLPMRRGSRRAARPPSSPASRRRGLSSPRRRLRNRAAHVAGVAVPPPTGDENDDGAAGLPGSGVLGVADEKPFLAAAVLTLVAGLLIAMLALVTRFLRGSWNP